MMIFGRIDPAATIYVQSDPFNPTTVTGSYIAAVARPYVLGTNSVNFQVAYGDCIFDEAGEIIQFNNIFNSNATLSGLDIETWGTDDTVVLGEIAQQQGTQVLEYYSSSINIF
jgi:signal peptidase I